MHLFDNKNDESEKQLSPNEIRRATGFNPRPLNTRNNFAPQEIRRRTGFNPTLLADRKQVTPATKTTNYHHACPLKNDPPNKMEDQEDEDEHDDDNALLSGLGEKKVADTTITMNKPRGIQLEKNTEYPYDEGSAPFAVIKAPPSANIQTLSPPRAMGSPLTSGNSNDLLLNNIYANAINHTMSKNLKTMEDNHDDEPTHFTAPEPLCYPPPSPCEYQRSAPVANNKSPPNKTPHPAPSRAMDPPQTLMSGNNCIQEDQDNGDEPTHFTAPEPCCYPPPPPPFHDDEDHHDDDTLVTMDEISLFGQLCVHDSTSQAAEGRATTGGKDIYFEPPTTMLSNITEEGRPEGGKTQNTTHFVF